MESPAYHPHSYVGRQISRNGFWHCKTTSIRSSALLLPGPSLRHPREQRSVPRVWQTFERSPKKDGDGQGWKSLSQTWPKDQAEDVCGGKSKAIGYGKGPVAKGAGSGQERSLKLTCRSPSLAAKNIRN